ncbi:transcription regulator HTH, apses-type DNA-binding domain-containing protein [Fimicolochytrium jonesii]|uniref:transcription regulator HTH, apses-type DNA-binding domain-containing protein n=1 Tax=Fimicolochytrium jonesii TaxID=1396493 RepID=UPI0022FDC8D6|nr:transcription regulator HTH, apses-type DNA-binding domain-containing protein [Fimicolochytrium jonesii]KAI8818029.1 transcription regulator HTH, apses-type DNA-binding domain-containing protein [Fimicolochytrium jonesii]
MTSRRTGTTKRSTAGATRQQATPIREGLYEATYSNITVYEMTTPNGVGVMRRKTDSWINATHILKAAGMEKSRRTKVLEREVHQGEHEKIQGGYGKYQGTWIPLAQAQHLATEYGLGEFLRDLFELPAQIPSAAQAIVSPVAAVTPKAGPSAAAAAAAAAAQSQTQQEQHQQQLQQHQQQRQVQSAKLEMNASPHHHHQLYQQQQQQPQLQQLLPAKRELNASPPRHHQRQPVEQPKQPENQTEIGAQQP